MSQIEKVCCDGCGKEVREGHNKGWIRINATEDYSVDLITGEDSFLPLSQSQLDFCSLSCLRAWFKKAIAQAQELS